MGVLNLVIDENSYLPVDLNSFFITLKDSFIGIGKLWK